MTSSILVEFGATKRGQTRHLLVAGASLCGQADADQLNTPGAMAMWLHDEPWVLTNDRTWARGGRIAKLPVCQRCSLHAAALHAAASDG